jgi:hypothetical protein
MSWFIEVQHRWWANKNVTLKLVLFIQKQFIYFLIQSNFICSFKSHFIFQKSNLTKLLKRQQMLLNWSWTIDDWFSDKLNAAALFPLSAQTCNPILFKNYNFVWLAASFQDGSRNIECLLGSFCRPVASNIESVDEENSLVPTIKFCKSVSM